jgi:hypothetical protein
MPDQSTTDRLKTNYASQKYYSQTQNPQQYYPQTRKKQQTLKPAKNANPQNQQTRKTSNKKRKKTANPQKPQTRIKIVAVFKIRNIGASPLVPGIPL